MQDRIVVDFEALNQIAGRLSGAGRDLDRAMNALSGLRMTRAGGAELRLSGCGRTLRTVGGTVSAMSVSAAVANYKTALGRISGYTDSLRGAVQNASGLFETTERGLVSGAPEAGSAPDNVAGGNSGPDGLSQLIIGPARAIPGLLPLLSPIAPLLYITSGIAVGNFPGFVKSDRTPSADAEADWLGYSLSEDHPGVTAWVGKAGAKAENQYASGEVNAYLGKGKAEAKFEASLMKTEKKQSFKNGEWTEKESTTFVNAELGGSAKASVVAADVKGSVGSDMLGVDVSADGGLGNGTLEGKGKFSIGEDGVNINASGKAMVSAAEGKASGTVNILGLEITGKVGGYAGAVGVEGKIGVENNKFVMEGGLAAVLGVSGGVEIGFNETGWNNFVDFITFWD